MEKMKSGRPRSPDRQAYLKHLRARRLAKRHCMICGTSLSHLGLNRQTCSELCKQTARQQKIRRKQRRQRARNPAKYLERSRRINAREKAKRAARRNAPRHCVICGNSIAGAPLRQKFCSTACHSISIAASIAAPYLLQNCLICGRAIESRRPRKYCGDDACKREVDRRRAAHRLANDPHCRFEANERRRASRMRARLDPQLADKERARSRLRNANTTVTLRALRASGLLPPARNRKTRKLAPSMEVHRPSGWTEYKTKGHFSVRWRAGYWRGKRWIPGRHRRVWIPTHSRKRFSRQRTGYGSCIPQRRRKIIVVDSKGVATLVSMPRAPKKRNPNRPRDRSERAMISALTQLGWIKNGALTEGN